MEKEDEERQEEELTEEKLEKVLFKSMEKEDEERQEEELTEEKLEKIPFESMEKEDEERQEEELTEEKLEKIPFESMEKEDEERQEEELTEEKLEKIPFESMEKEDEERQEEELTEEKLEKIPFESMEKEDEERQEEELTEEKLEKIPFESMEKEDEERQEEELTEEKLEKIPFESMEKEDEERQEEELTEEKLEKVLFKSMIVESEKDKIEELSYCKRKETDEIADSRVIRSWNEATKVTEVNPITPVIRKKQNTNNTAKSIMKDRLRVNGGIEDIFNSYEFAIMLLDKYHLCHLAEGEDLLWVFNGKCYEPLPKDKLEALIYQALPEYVKETSSSPEKKVKSVAEYINGECRQKILKSEKNGRFYRSFKMTDLKKVYGRVVLKNGVYDILEGELLEFDASLPYYYSVKARFLKKSLDKELDTPYFDKILKDATGNDKDSIMMIHYALGMLLLPNKCKKFIVAGNASNSGKSLLFGKFLDILLDSTRIYRVDTSKLGDKFSLGGCEDKLYSGSVVKTKI